MTNNHYEQIAKITKGKVCYQGSAFISFHNLFPEIELYEDKQHENKKSDEKIQEEKESRSYRIKM